MKQKRPSMRGWYKRKSSDGVELPQWRRRYTDHTGKRKEFIGVDDIATSRKLYSEKLLDVVEAKRRLSLGLPLGGESDYKSALKDFLMHGRAGGWSVRYANQMEQRVKEIFSLMNVNRLEAVTLEAFERAMMNWPEIGTHYTVGGYFKTFLNWCQNMGRIAWHPLGGWPGKMRRRKLKTKRTQPIRRPLTFDEARRLLDVSSPECAFAYEFALLAGARSSEVTRPLVEDLKDQGITAKTKNGEIHLFEMPAEYIARLREHTKDRLPKAPLFAVSKNHKIRMLRKNLIKAGIQEVTPEGKIDFHSLRNTFTNWAADLATDPQTLRNVARHSSLNTTFEFYLRSNEQRRRAIHDGVGAKLNERHQNATLKKGIA